LSELQALGHPVKRGVTSERRDLRRQQAEADRIIPAGSRMSNLPAESVCVEFVKRCNDSET
jgi:hypothetical protein